MFTLCVLSFIYWYIYRSKLPTQHADQCVIFHLLVHIQKQTPNATRWTMCYLSFNGTYTEANSQRNTLNNVLSFIYWYIYRSKLPTQHAEQCVIFHLLVHIQKQTPNATRSTMCNISFVVQTIPTKLGIQSYL